MARTRQPSGIAVVDPSYPYARNLRGAWISGQSGLLQNASKLGGLGDLTAVGAPTVIATPYGLGVQLNGSSQYLTNTSNAAITQFPFTFFLLVYMSTGQTGSSRIFDISQGTGISKVAGIRHEDGAGYRAQVYDGGNSQTNGSNKAKGTWNSFAGRFSSASERSLFVNGALFDTNSETRNALSGIDRITIGFAPWGAEYLNGIVVAPLAFDAALPDAEIAALASNPYRWVKQQRRLWIQLGAATEDTYALTADDLTGATPTLGTPALTETAGANVSLTANNLTSAVPTLGTPALTQDHAVTATGLTSSSPTEGQPALSQDHVVTATGLTGSAPTEGTPALSQLHGLTATALTSSAPTLGTPALSIQAGDTWDLIANEITSSVPTLGTPALNQDHVIVATALTAAVPSLGTPALTQNHDLGATEIAGSAPLLGTPAILSDTYTLTADNLVGSAAILANPQIIVDTSTVTVESIAASGGGGASTKRWMKESGLEDDIDREARKLGLKLPKKPAKKTKQLLEEEIEEIVEEELEEQIEELKQEEKEEFVSREEFARLEVVAEKRNTELLERLDVMEARLMRQLKRNEEEYLIWRALAERAI